MVRSTTRRPPRLRHLPRGKFGVRLADNSIMRSPAFFVLAVTVVLTPHESYAAAFSWADTTLRPCAPGHTRESRPLEGELLRDYPPGVREISCWRSTGSGKQERDGLCIVADSTGRPVAEGYFDSGHRAGGWVKRVGDHLVQELWSGRARPDSICVPILELNSIVLDLRAGLPKGGHEYLPLGSFWWSQSPAAHDSTLIQYANEFEGGYSPTWVFRLPRSAGIRVVHWPGAGHPSFDRIFAPHLVQTIGYAHSIWDETDVRVRDPLAPDSLAKSH